MISELNPNDDLSDFSSIQGKDHQFDAISINLNEKSKIIHEIEKKPEVGITDADLELLKKMC
jgi:hypothetical protein